jgi:hypothetical protein
MHRLTVLCGRALPIVFDHERSPETDVRLVIVGAEAHHLAVFRDRPIRITILAKHGTEIGVRNRRWG